MTKYYKDFEKPLQYLQNAKIKQINAKTTTKLTMMIVIHLGKPRYIEKIRYTTQNQ